MKQIEAAVTVRVRYTITEEEFDTVVEEALARECTAMKVIRDRAHDCLSEAVKYEVLKSGIPGSSLEAIEIISVPSTPLRDVKVTAWGGR